MGYVIPRRRPGSSQAIREASRPVRMASSGAGASFFSGTRRFARPSVTRCARFLIVFVGPMILLAVLSYL
jgi:hypothetical protein